MNSFKIDYDIRLDLQYEVNNNQLKFKKSNINTNSLKVIITRAGEIINLENIIPILYTITPAGNILKYECTNKNEYIHIILPATHTAILGTYSSEILLSKDNKRTVTNNFKYIVGE